MSHTRLKIDFRIFLTQIKYIEQINSKLDAGGGLIFGKTTDSNIEVLLYLGASNTL